MRIALVTNPNDPFLRSVIQGVLAFRDETANWELRLFDFSQKHLLNEFLNWKFDGVLLIAVPVPMYSKLQESGRMRVSLLCEPNPDLKVQIAFDDVATARLAAKHLLDQSCRHFAFVRLSDEHWAVSREAVFQAALAEHKQHSAVFADTNASSTQIENFLRSLPKPCGVFAANDWQALRVANVARSIGLDIPGDLALLGVDNDPICCGISTPPLSSIQQATHALGRQSAALLDSLLHGEPAPVAPILLPPVELIARQSSNILAIEDPELAAAIQFIHTHAHEHINVADVFNHVMCSRRWLQDRFSRTLGRSPLEEIRRVRLQRVSGMLVETELDLSSIAKRCGFSDSSKMASVFRRELGQTPSEFRRLARAPGQLRRNSAPIHL